MWRWISRSASGRGRQETLRRRADSDQATRDTVAAVRMYTRTTPAQVVALCEAVRYITASGVHGDVVECGVWRGGSMMAAARTLLECGDRSRGLWLYDTFSGISDPGGDERERPAAVSLPAVERTIAKAGYPASRIRYVVGQVADTIPETMPPAIALLRIGSDRYDAARHELEHLGRRMSRGAVLIVDDYGTSQGARRAVDEFIDHTHSALLLHRIDHAARIGVVASASSVPLRQRHMAEGLALAVR